MNNILIMLLVIPLVMGLVSMLLRGREKTKLCKVLTLISCILTFAFSVMTFFAGDLTLHIWQITENIPFDLALDDLSRIFVLLFNFIWLIVCIYSFEYLEEDKKQERFFGYYLLSLFTLNGIAMSSNIMTFYVFFESMTLVAFPLIIHNETDEAREGAFKYLFYSVAGAFIALGGIFLLVLKDVPMEFKAGGVGAFGSDTMTLVATMLILVGFGTKAGLFPMHAWLPIAHPVAPAPASAVMSGIITKTGVLAIIRIIFYYIGVDNLKGTWVQYSFMVLTLITVFMGSMLAYKEKIFKKRLAYSTVSQVSYVLFGLSLMNPLGFTGAILHVLFHSLIKNTLFMSAGAVIHKTEKTEVKDLKGMGYAMPVTMWCFTIAGIALVGIPPLNAFLSKWFLMQGALSSGMSDTIRYGGPAVLLVSALLTAGYLVTISLRAFFVPEEEYRLPKNEAGFEMKFAQIVLTVLIVALGVYCTPLVNYINNIATTIMGGM